MAWEELCLIGLMYILPLMVAFHSEKLEIFQGRRRVFEAAGEKSCPFPAVAARRALAGLMCFPQGQSISESNCRRREEPFTLARWRQL